MTGVRVYRNGKVYVRASRCDRCLFSADRLVSGERARELVASARSVEGGCFVCHRSMVSEEPEAICAAYFEAFAGEDPVLRLAVVLGVVERVGD